MAKSRLVYYNHFPSGGSWRMGITVSPSLSLSGDSMYHPKGDWGNFRAHVLIMEATDFIVALDEVLDVDWMASDALEKRLQEASADGFGEALNRVATLEGISIGYLSQEQKTQFRRMVGEGVVRALQFDFGNSKQILDRAEEYVVACNIGVARTWYLRASTIAAMLTVASMMGGWISRTWLSALLGPTAPEIALCCAAGAFGALLSVFQRMGKSTLDPSAGPKLHQWEGAGRILLGAGAALIAVLALKLELILPQITHSEHPLVAYGLLCLVAGISERLVPAVINKIETSVSTESTSKSPATT